MSACLNCQPSTVYHCGSICHSNIEQLRLDPGIEYFVRILRSYGVDTYESCESGFGHAFLAPTIRFHGNAVEGFRAYAVAAEHGLPVKEVMRIWDVIDGTLNGPHWQMTFTRKTNDEENAENAK